MNQTERGVILRPVFSMRLHSKRSAKEVSDSLSNALTLELNFDRWAPGGAEVYSVGALGLWMDLVAWPPWPIEDLFTYQFQGRLGPDLPYGDSDQICDISAHVIDILERRGVPGWYIPSDEQVLQELDLGEQMDSDD